ncbi:MAG: S41 family peptidase [Defluviitaleaceae bacterium]|nr:S41 family peptidase [Defluviitaleaceae bacterium]
MNIGIWRLSIIFASLLALAACSDADYAVHETKEYIAIEEVAEYVDYLDDFTEYDDDEEPIIPAAIASLPPAHYADIFSSGRTRGEYLADLDYLYDTLVANFPFFGVIYRRHGVDMHTIYQQTRHHIETFSDITSDHQFANLINTHFINHVRGAGHFNMLSGDFLLLHIQSFSNQIALGCNRFTYFLQEMDNPTTRALHSLTDDDFAPPVQGEDSFVFATTSNNIEARIIEEGRIAYVNILQMNHATMGLDHEKLLAFYRDIADFDHLIIDIRQNGGGDSRFFPELVIAPNISEPLEYYFYMFMMDGEHNRRLLAPWFENWWEDDAEYPIFAPIHEDLLEQLIYLHPEDAAMLDSYWTWRGAVYPSQNEAIFGGKVWLLTSGTNFSSSEMAAAITKQTGFATLVGHTTGGDGIGINPLVVALPNTGIVVRYSSVYGTDPLGRNNQEFGTQPHHFNMAGMDALQTTLALIEEHDQ